MDLLEWDDWSARRGLNSQHLVWKTSALPTELLAHERMQIVIYIIEYTISFLVNLSYSPPAFMFKTGFTFSIIVHVSWIASSIVAAFLYAIGDSSIVFSLTLVE